MELDDSGPLDTEWIKVFEKTDKLYQDFYLDNIYNNDLRVVVNSNNFFERNKYKKFF